MAETKTKKKSNVILLTAIIGAIFVAVVVLLTILLVQKNGFVFENDKVYYYKNGDMQVGVVEVDNKVYYFRENGEMHTGWLKWGGDVFYYRKGKGGDDFGGDLAMNTKLLVSDVDGVYWTVEFGDNGRVVSYLIAEEKNAENGKDITGITAPNFGA